jgi:hypothetical protein
MTTPAVALLISMMVQAAPRPAPPAQAQPQSQQRSGGSIEGIVTRTGSNQPLVRAQVTAVRIVTQAVQPGATPQTQAIALPPVYTDGNGKFVLKDLPPGSYRISAVHNSFARQDYGERGLRSAGQALNLQAGQTLKDISFHLTPAGSISGRVLDSAGEPAAGIIVQLLVSSYTPGGKQVLSSLVGIAKTNDLGEYRLHSLTPGPYYLNAITPNSYIQSIVNSQQAAAAGTPQAGNANTNSLVTMVESLLGLNSNSLTYPGLAATFYPEGTDRTKALPVDVKPGADTRLNDITMVEQTTFHIRGRLTDTRERLTPFRANIQMAPKKALGLVPFKSAAYDPRTGTFEFRDIAAGEYLINAIAESAGKPAALAQETIEVKGNVENLLLNARPGVVLSGIISLDGQQPLSSMPELSRMAVTVIPVAEDTVSITAPVPIKPDGSFTLQAVAPGTYRLGIVNLPATVYLKQARFGATDILEENLTVSDQSSESFEVVLGRSDAQVSGTVVDKDVKPVSAIQVVLAPEKHRDRRELFKVRTTDQSGKFNFQGVPPGDYKIFSWDDIDPYAFTDPAVLAKYDAQAKPVKVTAPSKDTKETVEVKLITVTQ